MIVRTLRIFLFLLKIILKKNFYFDMVKSQNKNQENLFATYLSKFLTNKNGIELGYHFTQFNLVGLYKKLQTYFNRWRIKIKYFYNEVYKFYLKKC